MSIKTPFVHRLVVNIAFVFWIALTITHSRAHATYTPDVDLHAIKNDLPVPYDTIISHALSLIGTPYMWGGSTPNGFDCSGFIKYVFAKTGVYTPRTISEIWNYSSDVPNPSIGDLVFFETYKPGPSHAGIYLGNGNFIHAGSSSGVKISNLNSKYWKSKYIGSKRINIISGQKSENSTIPIGSISVKKAPYRQ
ncbi:C40 family peptidase [Calidifontibacillus erzurumensis]|uniref:C40 family peptidase n=1 Tax=Calidifontibacillus erzurumensis TaxID=2741433 RepID=A0A8J8GC82_9BACI|nr:C40 family peptidase [Calidifontibacillus erzurumensis]NSL51017.1 C40 family peptidase [Calidifontibacillus erzurumensis]